VNERTRNRTCRPLMAFLAVASFVSLAVAYRFAMRPDPPPIPEPDLYHADPEVATAIETAIRAVRERPRDAARWGALGMALRANDFDMPSVDAFAAAELFDPKDYRWPYLQGLTLVLFEPEAGLACLRRAADRAPEDAPGPRLRLAECLLERGRVDEAADLMVNDRGVGREAGRAAWILARVDAERGNWNGVIERTATHRDDPSVRKRLASLRAGAWNRLGRADEAARELARTLELPDDQGIVDRCIAEALAFRCGVSVEIEEGTKLLAAGRADEAIPILERAADKSRDPIPAKLLLCRAWNQTGHASTARALLDEVFRVRPDSIDAWFQLGVADLVEGRFAEAEQAYLKVVTLKPDHAWGHFQLGYARMKLGNQGGATASYEAALRCHPDKDLAGKTAAALREVKERSHAKE